MKLTQVESLFRKVIKVMDLLKEIALLKNRDL
jgi:hypothetical protein